MFSLFFLSWNILFSLSGKKLNRPPIFVMTLAKTYFCLDCFNQIFFPSVAKTRQLYDKCMNFKILSWKDYHITSDIFHLNYLLSDGEVEKGGWGSKWPKSFLINIIRWYDLWLCTAVHYDLVKNNLSYITFRHCMHTLKSFGKFYYM